MLKASLVPALAALALTLSACQTNRGPDPTAGRESQAKMNTVLNNSAAPPQGEGELGGESGSSTVRQPP